MPAALETFERVFYRVGMAAKLPVHVWVVESSSLGGGPVRPPKPGLLIAWRWMPQGSKGWWEGLVVMGTSGDDFRDRWTIKTDWVLARCLRPVE